MLWSLNSGHIFIVDSKYLSLHCGSEIRTCPDFEWSIFVGFLNGLDFEWFIQPRLGILIFLTSPQVGFKPRSKSDYDYSMIIQKL